MLTVPCSFSIYEASGINAASDSIKLNRVRWLNGAVMSLQNYAEKRVKLASLAQYLETSTNQDRTYNKSAEISVILYDE